MYPVRCTSCKRRLGWSKTDQPYRGVYCSERCSEILPVGPQEIRNDIIAYLSRKGLDSLSIAARFDTSRQNIDQILDVRGVHPKEKRT